MSAIQIVSFCIFMRKYFDIELKKLVNTTLFYLLYSYLFIEIFNE